MIYRARLLLLCLVLSGAHAVGIDDTLMTRYYALTADIRCPVCQGQNILESDADIARQLRALVMQQLQDGRSDDEILYYLQQRYGDFIYFAPPVRIHTLLLWLGPFVFVIGALWWFITIIRRQKR